MFKEFIFVENNKNNPNEIIIIPATKFRLSVNPVILSDNTLLINTPRIEKIIENPKTKNIVFNNMFILFIWKLDSCFVPISANVVPDMYAKKAGIIGKMHGATNDPNPANNATSIVGSDIPLILDFSLKFFLLILDYSKTFRF